MCSYIVNQIKNIRSLKYLELGIFDGRNFNSVSSLNKTSVDIKPPAMFVGTTDEYFSNLPKNKKFDVIYIDACHDAEFVVRDFNNSVDHLEDKGLILAHDFIPGSKKLTADCYCGTAFKVLSHVLKYQQSDFCMSSLSSDYGLTLFVNPKNKIKNFNPNSFTYEDFLLLTKRYQCRSREEMQNFVRSL